MSEAYEPTYRVRVAEWGGFGDDITAPDGQAAVDGLIDVLRTGGLYSLKIADQLNVYRQIGRNVRDIALEGLSEGTAQ